MIYGADNLGGMKFEKLMIKTHPQGWAGGLMLRTFGDARKTLQRMCASRKFSEIIVHLAPFDHSHQYPIDKYLPGVKKDAQWISSMPKYGTTILLSPFCEHLYQPGVMKPIFDNLQKLAPTCIMINSGKEIPGIITDVHLANSDGILGSNPTFKKPKGEYSVSFDGFGGKGEGNFTDTDVNGILNFFSDSRHIRLWDFRYNGKLNWQDNGIPEQERINWPNEQYLRGHNAMMKKRDGVIPNRNFLYKAFAEDSISDSKACKALIIAPVNKSSIKVFDIHGTQIDTMTRYKPDFIGNPKGARYYSTKYAFQIANIAEKNTGSRMIQIDALPDIDGDLRSGYFK